MTKFKNYFNISNVFKYMKSVKLITEQTLTCDQCGKVEILTDELSTWLTVIETETNDLRLFERAGQKNRYESFNIPNKTEKNYCSSDCALQHFKQSMDLFVASLTPLTRTSKYKELK